jgi:isocitrate dehydrogenase
VKEGHLRWDSLGEYCALVPSLELIAEKTGNQKAALLAQTLDQAITKYLENGRLPSRKVNEIDNRGSTFYLTFYWAQTLAAQNKDPELRARFAKLAKELERNEAKIVEELLAAQGNLSIWAATTCPTRKRPEKVMRPSRTFNAIIDAI